MKQERFSHAMIAGILREAERGEKPAGDLCQEDGHLRGDSLLHYSWRGDSWSCSWSCSLQQSDRACHVHCLEKDPEGVKIGHLALLFESGPPVEGPQYMVIFREGPEKAATGRTPSKTEMIAAVADWLDGQQAADLRRHFEFVDETKRPMEALEGDIVHSFPRLDEMSDHRVEKSGWFMDTIYELLFRAHDRSCQLSYDYELDVMYLASFRWDETELFQVETHDARLLGRLMERWLCDYDPPSAMRSQFPELEIGRLADDYEAGRGIEGEFLASWDDVEAFYQDFFDRDGAWWDPILDFVRKIREAGYDTRLRAGTSLYSLIVSRSRRHGLREGQPSIGFSWPEGTLLAKVHLNGETKVQLPEIAFTAQVDDLLRQLADHEID